MTPSFEIRLAKCGARVEVALDALLAARAGPGELARPARLLAAMRHAALGGGKRLRPFLVVETAAMLGARGARVLRAACAVECVHCYSLVHDDLPAMDDDDLRRGRPTAHKAFDEATAILAGDALLTLAFDIAAAPPTHPDPAIRADFTLGLARASGLGGMAGGQMLDLDAERHEGAFTRKHVELLQAMKTGALLRFSVEAGAILAGASAAERKALNEYGRALGAAFQIADDILDAEGDTVTLGKRAGKDAGRHKATLVGVSGIEGARAIRDDFVARAIRALDMFGDKAGVLAAAARFVAAREF